MKSVKPLLGLVFLLSCLCATAQEKMTSLYVSSVNTFADHSKVALNDPYGVRTDFQQHAANEADVPGQRMMRVGNGLIIGGSILTVSGIFLMVTADELYYRTSIDSDGNTITEGDPKGALGVLMVVGGVGMIIPGAIVWSKGKKKYEAYQSTGASLSLGINRHGAGLRLRF